MVHNTHMDLASKLEAILFSEGGALTKKKLLQLLDISPEDLKLGIDALKARRLGTAIELIESDQEVALAISKDATPIVQAAFERELGREIGDAGLEVLAIVLYRGPSTRAQIDYIRGVNTSSTIRTLAARGLVERAPNPADAREYLYRPTLELLAHLGVRDAQELPGYAKISNELAAFEEPKEDTGPFTDHATDTDSDSAADDETSA